MNEPKSHFKSWCFLCSRDESVDIEIAAQNETIRETIGQFSFLVKFIIDQDDCCLAIYLPAINLINLNFQNYSLPNMPSKICVNCHWFLAVIEKRKQLYAKVEQMYLELIRMPPSRSTPADYAEIKTRYNIQELLNAADNISDDKMLEVQVEYFTESNLIEGRNWNFEIVDEKIDQVPSSPVEIICKKMTRSTTMKSKRTREISKVPISPKFKVPTIPPPAEEIIFQCDVCSKSFKSKIHITKHITSFHMGKNKARKLDSLFPSSENNTGKTFECNVCSKLFKTVSTELYPRLFSTFKCNKINQILQKTAMIEHEKTHSDIKNHVCPHCKKGYKTASTLAQHLDTHDKTTYECNECGAKLNTRRTLRQHQLKHSEVAKHTCQFCQAQFKRTKTYKEHLICIHTDIKAYNCDWCDRKFSNGANCRKHKKEIHPEALKKAENKMEKVVVTLPTIQELIEISRKRLNNVEKQ